MKLSAKPGIHAADSYGVLLRRDAVARGINDNALARLVDQGVLVKLRHGTYCLRHVWMAANDAERHRLLCRGVMRLYADHVALSHASSCVDQGGPTYGLNLSQVQITHLSGGGRVTVRLRHHEGDCRVGDVRRKNDYWLTTPPRACLEAACSDGAEAGLVQANHFLHAQEMTREQLEITARSQTFWPGSLVHHPILFLADARIESVGETRCDYTFFTQGLPRPELQYEVRDGRGHLVGRVDFAWPALKVIVEFDGLEKYHRYRKPGETIEQMVMREKKREDRIRELTGWTVIRVTWAELAFPVNLANRLRAAFAGRAA